MPATAGRVRMPANNRVHSSAALQTHGIWQSAIGYDPYAPSKDDKKKPAQETAEPDSGNAYKSYQELIALARLTGSSNADDSRGACKRCGRVGHLTFQCRNFLSVKDDIKGKDADLVEAAVLNGLEKLKGDKMKKIRKNVAEGEESSSEEEESESSDSEYDSEIERAIGKKFGKSVKTNSTVSCTKGSDLSDDDGSDYGDRKKRSSLKKRSSRKKRHGISKDDDHGWRKRKAGRRKRDESSDEDETSDEDHSRRKRKSSRRRKDKSSDEDESSDEDHSRRKRKASRRRKDKSSDEDESSDENHSRRKRKASRRRRDESSEDHGRTKRKKGSRRREHESSDEDEDHRRRNRKSRRRRDESSDEDDQRRRSGKSKKDRSKKRSHHHSDDTKNYSADSGEVISGSSSSRFLSIECIQNHLRK